jgi:hypothetical protein
VYGPRQALSNPYTGVMAIFSARLLNGRAPLIFEDGLQSRDFVHVSDVVQANLLAAEIGAAGGRIYNVGTGHGTTILRGYREAAAPARCRWRGAAGPLPRRRRAPASPTSRASAPSWATSPVSLEQGMKEPLEWLRTGPRRIAWTRPRASSPSGASARDEGRRRASSCAAWAAGRLLRPPAPAGGGDAMLDEYLWWGVERVSRAPVPVVHVQRESVASAASPACCATPSRWERAPCSRRRWGTIAPASGWSTC